MFESMKITRASLHAAYAIATLDLSEHLLDVRGWILAARGLTEAGEFPARIDRRLIAARLTQRLAHPFGHGHPVTLGDATNLGDLGVFEQDLQSRSRALSITDSWV